MESDNRTRHDLEFKLLLGEFFFEFIELFFPELHKQINQSVIERLDKELVSANRAVNDGQPRRGIADLAVKTQILYDASKRQMRLYRFKLIDYLPDISDVYRFMPTREGYLVYLGMLDLAPEDAAELMEKMLHLLI